MNQHGTWIYQYIMIVVPACETVDPLRFLGYFATEFNVSRLEY